MATRQPNSSAGRPAARKATGAVAPIRTAKATKATAAPTPRATVDESAPQKVVFIGAAGEMCRVAIERFAYLDGNYHLVLTDIRPELLTPLAAKMRRGMVTVERLDLFDREALLETVTGAALVVLGAGPYVRTSAPVVEACLQARVPYLDFDDDVESTEHALSLNDRAVAAGIPMYIGCGASPGLSNVLAVDAAADLDTVDRIDLCWLVGEERPNVGRAVLEHMLSISGGECHTWEGGRRVVHESFVETGKFPILAGEPHVLLYETAHPEPVTLPRKYPDADRIRCVGGLDPAALNGLFRGMALAVQKGRIGQKYAVDMIEDVATGGFGDLDLWRAGAPAMIRQVRRRESSAAELGVFLAKSAVRRRYPYKGGFLSTAYGTKDGRPHRSSRRTAARTGSVLNNMGGVTGTACAAFAVLALGELGRRAGAFAPEDWAEPTAFYRALEHVGVPRHEIVESL